MPPVTQSQSKSQEPRRRSNSMPGNFSNLDPVNSSPSENLLDNLLDELALETHLDLSQHPAHKLINLSEHHIFHSASKFRRIVAANGARIFYLLARIVEYNFTIHKKVTKHYAEWEQINWDHMGAFWNTTKKLTEAKKELAQSQSKFTDMQKERDCLQIDLESAKIWINTLIS